MYCTVFSVRSLLQYIVSVTYTKFLYIDITIVLKSSDEIQQTASIRLNTIPRDITVIYVTYFQMYYYLMQYSFDYWLPNDLNEMRLVYCNCLKPNHTNHIIKCVSFSADKVLLCNSQIHYDTLNNRNSYSVNTVSHFSYAPLIKCKIIQKRNKIFFI